MNIIVSCHCDTVFTHPFFSWDKGLLVGALDNFASILACSIVIKELGENVTIEFTDDEEMSMEGAKQLAQNNDNKSTLFIVLDVTEATRNKLFTIENIHRVKAVEVKRALKDFRDLYRVIPRGGKSEANLYAMLGFCTIEVDVPIRGGIHNLKATTKFANIHAVADAVVALIKYFSIKPIEEITDDTTI